MFRKLKKCRKVAVHPELIWSEQACIVDLHFQYCFSGVWHGGTDDDIVTLKRNAWTVSLCSHKVVFTAIIHHIIQIMVTVASPFKDSHSKPVRVEHSVKGHRKHDGQKVAVVMEISIEQVVGEDAHSSGGSACCLVEHGGCRGARTHHGWQGILTQATLHEYSAHSFWLLNWHLQITTFYILPHKAGICPKSTLKSSTGWTLVKLAVCNEKCERITAVEISGCYTEVNIISPWVGESVVSRHIADLNVAVAMRHGEDVLIQGCEPKATLFNLGCMICSSVMKIFLLWKC